jgi:hypothetical protein
MGIANQLAYHWPTDLSLRSLGKKSLAPVMEMTVQVLDGSDVASKPIPIGWVLAGLILGR